MAVQGGSSFAPERFVRSIRLRVKTSAPADNDVAPHALQPAGALRSNRTTVAFSNRGRRAAEVFDSKPYGSIRSGDGRSSRIR